MLLPLVLMGKITHEEAGVLREQLVRCVIKDSTVELLEEIEDILGRKI